MIDDGDVELVAFAGPGGLIGIILLLIVWFFAHQNGNECAKKHCDAGSPKLMNHACLCVSEAK